MRIGEPAVCVFVFILELFEGSNQMRNTATPDRQCICGKHIGDIGKKMVSSPINTMEYTSSTVATGSNIRSSAKCGNRINLPIYSSPYQPLRNVTVKVVPTLTALSTVISPCIISITRFTKASPRPLPWTDREVSP